MGRLQLRFPDPDEGNECISREFGDIDLGRGSFLTTRNPDPTDPAVLLTCTTVSISLTLKTRYYLYLIYIGTAQT